MRCVKILMFHLQIIEKEDVCVLLVINKRIIDQLVKLF